MLQHFGARHFASAHFGVHVVAETGFATMPIGVKTPLPWGFEGENSAGNAVSDVDIDGSGPIFAHACGEIRVLSAAERDLAPKSAEHQRARRNAGAEPISIAPGGGFVKRRVN